MSRLASSKTSKIWAERFAQCERSNAPVAQAYPGRRFALPWAISFCPFGADGSGAGQRPEAGGEREQPNSRKTLVRSSAGIQGSRKTRGLSPGISYGSGRAEFILLARFGFVRTL